jgi:hydrogenase maturation protease
MSAPLDAWDEIRTPPPAEIVAGGRRVTVGQRVRITPRPGGDVMDLALAGRTAVVEAVEMTTDGEPHVTVTIDDDPGRDFGGRRYPGHRFFFRADEVQPIDAPDTVTAASARNARVLVAGIGNIFFGDDAFGIAVARRLAERAMPASAGVTIADFGIRGLDLAYALQDGYDAAILVDAMPRGGSPGSLYVVDPDLDASASLAGAADAVSPDAHGMDPVQVLRLARSLGPMPKRILVVGCEPASLSCSEPSDTLGSLTPAVAGAVDEAIRIIESLVRDLQSNFRPQ